MQRSGFNSLYIYDNDKKELKNVTSLTVSNYAPVPLWITISGVKRKIPAYNPAFEVPYWHNFPADGTYCDITLEFEYEGLKTASSAILDYKTIKCD